MPLKYKRILLKLSGEVLLDRESGDCFDSAVLAKMAATIKRAADAGAEVGVVLGGGNIFRGLSGARNGTNRVIGDHMGMLSTVINALALKNALGQAGVDARVQSAIALEGIAEKCCAEKAMRHLSKGRVVIFAGGTGNPFFSTDSASALRACEIGADLLLKATKVDGVYTADPKKDPAARRYLRLTYADAFAKRLGVMDQAAFALCQDNGLPIVVFNFFEDGALDKAIAGEAVGTLVSDFTDGSLLA